MTINGIDDKVMEAVFHLKEHGYPGFNPRQVTVDREMVPVEIEIWPFSTLFRAGEHMCALVMGKDPFPPSDAPGVGIALNPVTRNAGQHPAEAFTVIHGGAEIDESLAAGLIDEVSDWAATAELGVTRVAEVWGSPWARLLAGCLATAAAAGGPLYSVSLPVADDLVAGLKARGVAVRYWQARQSVVDDAELRAISQGWPLRHI